MLTRRARLLYVGLFALLIGGVIYWRLLPPRELTRIEEVRQRVLPRLKAELRAAGFALDDPVFIRIFKETRELEVWLRPRDSEKFKLWKTWHVVGMSGHLGPKLAEGDRQAPEGFYEVDATALNPESDCHLSFNTGYPNTFDASLGRTGSWIMVHGSTGSLGCFAMTDPVIEEIYLVCEAALGRGQRSFFVHAFPFRMTEERMRDAATSEWLPFWENLREGYVRFEETHLPPTVLPEDGHYGFAPR